MGYHIALGCQGPQQKQCVNPQLLCVRGVALVKVGNRV